VAEAVAVAVAEAVAVVVAVALGVGAVVVVDADGAGTAGSVGFGSLHPASIRADDTSAATGREREGAPAPWQKGQSIPART